MNRASLAAVALALVVGLGCGKHKAAVRDGGGDGSMPTGRRSFDVVANLIMAKDAGFVPGAPSTSRFTLVLDTEARRAIVGGNGRAAVLDYTGEENLVVLPKFSVGVVRNDTCEAATSIEFTSFQVTVDGASLRGEAIATTILTCGFDCVFPVIAQAALSGVSDATPPALLPAGTVSASPLAPLSFVASEPLPATATARLVGSDGVSVDLVPSTIAGDTPLVVGFRKPDVILPPSEGFLVSFDRLVDFAGHPGDAASSLRLPASSPPLVPEDGFEGATATDVGGATIIRSPAVSGAQSVYVASPGAPAPNGVQGGEAMRVRLAVQPGDTKVLFSSRALTNVPSTVTVATVGVGAVGHKPGSVVALEIGGAGVWMPWGSSGRSDAGVPSFISDLSITEVALPAGVTDEVVVDIESVEKPCDRFAATPAGVLIDDLRVE